VQGLRGARTRLKKEKTIQCARSRTLDLPANLGEKSGDAFPGLPRKNTQPDPILAMEWWR